MTEGLAFEGLEEEGLMDMGLDIESRKEPERFMATALSEAERGWWGRDMVGGVSRYV